MSVVAAAVCPHPPLLVPELAGALAPQLDHLRAACDQAVGALLGADPDLVLVLGGGPETLAYAGADSGTLAGFGLDLRVPLGPAECGGQPILPLSLTIGGYLLGRSGWPGPRQGFGLGPGTAPARFAEQILDLDGRVGLLVMGDGSSRRSPEAPGAFDPRAADFDNRVAAALAAADAAALLALDPTLAAELGAGGVPAWQLLAEVAARSGQRWAGRLLLHDATYGVGYLVALWSPG